jgi:hypothetical protein
MYNELLLFGYIAMLPSKVEMLKPVEALKNSKLRCVCDCGNERVVSVGHFNTKKIKSCGCHVLRHGKHKSKEYISWSNMMARCHNPKNKRFKDYGGKGIVVCDRWKKFFYFYADMGDCPDGYQIDRINNKGIYEPSNCRWVTPKQNMSNRNISKKYVIDGIEYQSSIEAAYKIGVSPNTIIAWCCGRQVKNKFYPPKNGCFTLSN